MKTHHNACRHHPDTYIGSFENGGTQYDVYLFPDHGDTSVCIRYGSEGHEYMSPGTLSFFLRYFAEATPVYRQAHDLMMQLGTIKYELHKNTNTRVHRAVAL